MEKFRQLDMHNKIATYPLKIKPEEIKIFSLKTIFKLFIQTFDYFSQNKVDHLVKTIEHDQSLDAISTLVDVPTQILISSDVTIPIPLWCGRFL